VSSGAWFASRLSPAPVSVHDDGDMLRKSANIDQGHCERVSCGPEGSKNAGGRSENSKVGANVA